MSTEAKYYLEEKVAGVLGLQRRDVARLRNGLLKKKSGWVMAGREVALTNKGLDRVLNALRKASNAALPELDFSGCVVAGPTLGKKDAGGELVTLTVKKIYPNPRILQAEDVEKKLVSVQVKTNKNFLPGMKLNARALRPGWYAMEGRCPRSRGRY
jgi:hypothetical protein